MHLVLDASVCLRWHLFERSNETHVDIARELLLRVREGSAKLHQPAIWLSEVAAVLAREVSMRAGALVQSMRELQVEIDDDPVTMLRAIELSVELRHHLFDTLYHAIAIEHGIDLVTADAHYYRKARKLGHIVLLRDWRAPQGIREEPAGYGKRARKAPARARRKR